MCKVSVIIPVLNGAKHISNSLRFLSEQTFHDFEVIYVVDSKTDDDSISLINGQTILKQRISVIEQTDDEGLGGARNIGLNNASGEIVWFMDIDDRPLPEFLNRLVSIQENNDADVVFCNFVKSLSHDVGMFPPKKNYPVIKMDRVEALSSRAHEGIPVTAWSKIIRTEFLKRNGIRFRSGFAEDVDHTYRILLACETVYYCTEPLYVYLQSDDSICNSNKNNIRGRNEISTYDDLDGIVKSQCPDFYNEFKRRAMLTRIRSAVHMDYAEYIRYAKSKECRDMVKESYSDPVSAEAIGFTLLPWLYYAGLRMFFKLIYNSDMHCYTRI